MHVDAIAALEAYAAQRGWVFTTAEAAAHGITERMLTYHSRPGGRWRRLHRAVYAVVVERPPRWQGVAALLAVTPDGVATGLGAGLLLGLDAVGPVPQVSAPPGASHRHLGVRRRAIADDLVVEVHGLRCTSALATLVDLAAVLDDDEWECALESALRMRLCTLDAVRSAEARGTARSRIARVLRRRGSGKPTRSVLETRVVQLVRTIDAPEPERGFEVYDGSRFVGEVDLSWPTRGGYTECDGKAFHFGDAAFQRDRWRETDIASVVAWSRTCVTYRFWERHPRLTARKIGAFLGELGRRSARNRPS